MIKNIIFDFGGVLINLDYGLTDKALKDAFGLEFDGREYPERFIQIFDNYEKGSFSETGFFYYLTQLTDKNLSAKSLKMAWNKMILGLPPKRLNMLRDLKKKYNLILLSNTNKTHLDFVYNYLKVNYHIHNFEEQFFHHVFYSHQVKMRKPDMEIFQFVLKQCKIDPRQTIFIDDSAENLTCPKKLGIKSIKHPRNADIAALIHDYIFDK